jgi:hypothetical protein
MASAKDVVIGFQAAMGRDDWAGARAHLAERIDFVGPFDKFSRPEDYLAALQKLHPIVERVDMHHMFAEGDEVAMFYDLVTNSPAGTAFVAEWHHVTNGKIDRIRVVFDPRPFAPMIGKPPG